MNRPLSPVALWRRSIGARIAAMSLGLLLAIQVASFGAIRASLAEHARNSLPSRLEVGQRVLASLIERQAETLRQGAGMLAADYGFKTAVLSNDAETIASALENHGARIGATEAALLGTDFSIRASSGDGRALARIVPQLADAAAAGRLTGLIAVIDGRPHRVVLTPMRAPLTVGWVLMGFPLDRRLVEDMRSLSALELTLLVRTDDAAAWSVATSGETPGRASAFARDAAGDATTEATIRASEPSAEFPLEAGVVAPAPASLREVRVDGESFGLRSRLLAPSVLGVVSTSTDAATRLPGELQLALAVITVCGFGIFFVGSVFTARHVTVPLRRLSAAAERLGRGDSQTVFRAAKRSDEVGQLAVAFETMRVRIGEKQAEVLRLAYQDALTGLPNRARFRDALAGAIRSGGIDALPSFAPEDASGAAVGPSVDTTFGLPGQRRPAADPSVAVLILNLDRFKHVNDILGYRVGDLLLQRVAERLGREVLRGDDMVARLGGDEFAVLLRGADLVSAQAVAARIGLAFDEPLLLEDHTVDMGAGIGIACWPADADDAETLLGRAEMAMHTAKRRAQGPLAYDPSLDVGSSLTLSLLTDLRRAVELGEFRLYLQPKLTLGNGEVHAAEALVRWLHPERGLIPPMEFIPFAERTGFIRVLTIWVFEEAARHWLALGRNGPGMKIAINLSTRDLLDIELPAKFEALLTKHGVPATSLCLEITESAIMDDPQRSLATLDRLSALGFRLSIDDFGTGYSSLAYLKRLPVDELKIDRSFVMNMVHDLDDAKIVRSTIDLAHNLGLKVVAEGVENAEVLEALRLLDCDEAQGYHMGRPMPAHDFDAWSAAWTARRVAPAALPLH